MSHQPIKVTFLKLLVICFILSISIFSNSCQKSPINGDLDGQWQVMSVTPQPIETIIEERLYYCFSLHVCQLTHYGSVFTTGNMYHDSNLLHLDFPNANSPISIKKLRQYGINENPITFTIEHLDKKSLVIKNGETTVTLRKF